MKKRMIALLALLLACLMIITACGKKPAQGAGPDDPDQQQGSSGGTGDNQGGSGSGNGGTGNPDGGTQGSGGGGSSDGAPTQEQKLGTVDGVEYWLVEFQRDASSNDATKYQLNAVSGGAATVLYSTAGILQYAAGSLEASGNTALYFTASEEADGNATLYCYDLYSKEVQQVLAAPCSNMVVFSGSGQLDGYGWVLQDDYVMPIDLQNQTADMTMAASTMELSGFSSVGGSFFSSQQSASLKESEYGVLEITLKRGSSLMGYLYTCDTFTAVELK